MRWGMLQMALWGYSFILTLYILIFAFIPSSGTTSTKDVADIYYGVVMYAPLVVFWLWIVVQYKKYRWNWWRATLVANALLYSGVMLFGVVFPQPEINSSSGIDPISIMILLILVASLYFFGREQFVFVDKKKVK